MCSGSKKVGEAHLAAGMEPSFLGFHKIPGTKDLVLKIEWEQESLGDIILDLLF